MRSKTATKPKPNRHSGAGTLHNPALLWSAAKATSLHALCSEANTWRSGKRPATEVQWEAMPNHVIPFPRPPVDSEVDTPQRIVCPIGAERFAAIPPARWPS